MTICYKIHIFGFMSQHLCVSGSSARFMSLDSCLSIHVYLRILCKIHVAGFMSQQPYVSQDPLQDPLLRIHVSASLYLTDALQDPRQRLRIHVSASLNLRILCKIHVSGSMSPIHVSASICISGTSARSMSPDPYISIHIYLRILCKIHVSGSVYKHPYVSQDPLQDPCLRFMSQHLYTSGSPARSMCPIHVSASTCISGTSARSMSPDPYISIHMYLRILCKTQSPIHVSASLYLRVLCKIHVFGFMSQHLPISGFSARSMCPIHVLTFMSQHPFISQGPLQDPCLDSCRSIFVSQASLQDPCLRIHVPASTNMDYKTTRSTSLGSCLSIHMYLRNLCKIHVSGPVYKHPHVSQDPLQDPCLRIHVSASIYISGTSARFMSPDPYISIHMYLRLLCKIHVSGFMSQRPYISQEPLQDPCLRIRI